MRFRGMHTGLAGQRFEHLRADVIAQRSQEPHTGLHRLDPALLGQLIIVFCVVHARLFGCNLLQTQRLALTWADCEIL